MDKQTGNSGFTLIELLLSIFLVALISGILFASFFLPHRAMSAAKSELVATEEASVFLFRLSEDIGGVYPEPGSFTGTKNSISFLTTAGTESGLEAVSYTVKKDPAGEKVVLNYKDSPTTGVVLNYKDSPTTGVVLNYKDSPTTGVVVYRASELPWQLEDKKEGQPVLQAQDLVFGYYDGKEWLDKWKDDQNSPLLISVKLTRKGREFEILCGVRTSTGTDTALDSDSGAGNGGTSGLS